MYQSVQQHTILKSVIYVYNNCFLHLSHLTQVSTSVMATIDKSTYKKQLHVRVSTFFKFVHIIKSCYRVYIELHVHCKSHSLVKFLFTFLFQSMVCTLHYVHSKLKRAGVSIGFLKNIKGNNPAEYLQERTTIHNCSRFFPYTIFLPLL